MEKINNTRAVTSVKNERYSWNSIRFNYELFISTSEKNEFNQRMEKARKFDEIEFDMIFYSV